MNLQKFLIENLKFFCIINWKKPEQIIFDFKRNKLFKTRADCKNKSQLHISSQNIIVDHRNKAELKK